MNKRMNKNGRMTSSKETRMSATKCFPLLTLVVVLIGSISLTACGGGGPEAVTTIDVHMTDHQFTPDEFTVPAGAEITINLKNSGTQPHEFQIMVLGATAEAEKVDENGNPTKYWGAVAYAGESKSFSFTAPPEPGTYVIRCSVPGHTKAGMVGTLQVK
jgi:uncharacterized cupredoxin-like copper-binding protein